MPAVCILNDMHVSTVSPEIAQLNDYEKRKLIMSIRYTILYPLNERRQNAPASELYQMLKVNTAPIDARDKDLDDKCFPHLYVEGKYVICNNKIIYCYR